MQRIKFRKCTLPEEYIDRLLDLGFNFGAKLTYHTESIQIPEQEPVEREEYLEKLWDENFQQLVAYKEKMGDCDIPLSYESNPALGAWAFSQRMAYKKKKLSNARFERLRDLDFKF